MSRINVALVGHKEKYQPTMIELEGKIPNYVVSILIVPSNSLSYVSPKIVEMCQLQTSKFKHPWLVQLATRAKRRVTTKVENFPIEPLRKEINENLKMLPLVSYDVIIGME